MRISHSSHTFRKWELHYIYCIQLMNKWIRITDCMHTMNEIQRLHMVASYIQWLKWKKCIHTMYETERLHTMYETEGLHTYNEIAYTQWDCIHTMRLLTFSSFEHFRHEGVGFLAECHLEEQFVLRRRQAQDSRLCRGVCNRHAIKWNGVP